MPSDAVEGKLWEAREREESANESECVVHGGGLASTGRESVRSGAALSQQLDRQTSGLTRL